MVYHTKIPLSLVCIECEERKNDENSEFYVRGVLAQSDRAVIGNDSSNVSKQTRMYETKTRGKKHTQQKCLSHVKE